MQRYYHRFWRNTPRGSYVGITCGHGCDYLPHFILTLPSGLLAMSMWPFICLMTCMKMQYISELTVQYMQWMLKAENTSLIMDGDKIFSNYIDMIWQFH